MELLSSTELRDWGRRLIWSGAAAYLMAHSKTAVFDIGSAWAIGLAVLLVEDMASARGLAFVQRIIIAMVAALPAIWVVTVIRYFLAGFWPE